MKKKNPKILQYAKRRQLRLVRLEKRWASVERHHVMLKRLRAKRRGLDEIYRLRRLRDKIYRAIGKEFSFNKPPKNVEIDGEFGLEKEEGFVAFLEKSKELVDFGCKDLILDLRDSTRIWPSAVTLFCSLSQWVELISRKGDPPRIYSYPSNHESVNSYLDYCGFYDYVKIRAKPDSSVYDKNAVVRIHREEDRGNIECREKEIISLLQNYTELTDDDIEWFDSVILSEVFSNVTEHGIANRDEGWWILAQFHPTNQIVSLCIADNGIGFRHTLMSGPQREQLIQQVPDEAASEGDLINISMKANVSGALTAARKEEKSWLTGEKYLSGARRGNGLTRIKDVALKLGLQFTILSHYGYYRLDHAGVPIYGALPNRIFAGTLYHFSIPMRKKARLE